MKSILSLSFVLICLTGFSQTENKTLIEPETTHYRFKHLPDGVTDTLDDKYNHYRIQVIKENGYVTSYKLFHDNGKIWARYQYVDGKAEGRQEEYYEEGILQKYCDYKNDTLIKAEVFLYERNDKGDVYLAENHYWENSEKYICNLGSEEKIRGDHALTNPTLYGYIKKYYENGNLKSEGMTHSFGRREIWKFYNEKGELIKTKNYKAIKCSNIQ